MSNSCILKWIERFWYDKQFCTFLTVKDREVLIRQTTRISLSIEIEKFWYGKQTNTHLILIWNNKSFVAMSNNNKSLSGSQSDSELATMMISGLVIFFGRGNSGGESDSEFATMAFTVKTCWDIFSFPPSLSGRRQSPKWVCYNRHLLLQSTSQQACYKRIF